MSADSRGARRAGRVHGPRIGLRTGAIVVGLAVLLPLAAGAAVWAAGVPLLLPDEDPQGAVGGAPAPGPRTLTEARSPAITAIEALLAVGPGPGWAPAGPVARATTSVIDAACPVTAAPAPTHTAQRAFSRGRTGITVAVEVHGAGLGGQALDRRRARLGECAAGGALVTWSLRTRAVSAVASAFRPVGATSAVSSLIWRRGDVVLAVLAPGERPEGLLALADAVDATALRSLAGRCRDLAAPSTAASRSPWVARDGFTGLVVKETVTIPRLGLPAAPPGVVPVPLDRSFQTVDPVDLPTRPADPVWPPLPAPAALPVAPSSPGPEPTAAVVATPRRDPVGPGCGWAFTGQGAPTYDAAAAAATRAATIEAARGRLLLAQQAWRSAVVGYWQASARFETATATYAVYADQVRSVGDAWSAIEQARADYRSALVAYRAAVSARDTLLAEQATALRAYQAALAACTVAPTTPSPPTVPAVPEQPGASGPPAGTPAAPAPVCPPPRPAVLDRPVPPVPVPPVPPPDPRPTAPPASTPGGSPTR